MKHAFLIISFLACCVACKNSAYKEKEVGKTATVVPETPSKENIDSAEGSLYVLNSFQNDSVIKVENAIGVVSIIEDITEKDTVRIYNKDKTLWYKFSFYYDDSDGKYDFYKPEFSPLAFDPDSFLLCMKVSSPLENGGFKVQVNDATGEEKYIDGESSLFKFQTWEECVLGLFSIGFDNDKTPILSSTENDAKTLPYNEEELYHPNKIKGKWLQVKWGNENDWKYGWIQWRNNGKLLIEPYFSA